MSEYKTLLVKAKKITAIVEIIKQTLDTFEDCIEEHPKEQPTCNQSQYVKDVKFLLQLLGEKI